ncbi:MAG: Guanine deaminase [Microgenomates group bacterium GW2011_GWC1_37_8]|uniref:Guanine deaminase n=1 Tax=Candidatus Woesebacteria bacterium GW2011_GWB1_38_8 TaxID=1618570 RepID=A0A0G0P8L2_9BACT|nr:MAG: Guanine deaminase [Microgenomates group bacterium GW2011_GWC1_37_8]KKQ85631.1 MAG: Guanine deaminase [Candidatus Woesebacteria bacterium GW2011_GWB1_38_8]
MDDKDYLKLAVEQARKSVEQSGFPAGAIIVKDGKIVAEGISVGFKNNDPTGHAETAAIRAACQNLKTHNLEGAVMYESLECCNMCFSVAYWAGISKIFYACRKTPEMVKKLYYEGSTNNKGINESNNRQIELVFISDFEKESLEIVKDWESKQK